MDGRGVGWCGVGGHEEKEKTDVGVRKGEGKGNEGEREEEDGERERSEQRLETRRKYLSFEFDRSDDVSIVPLIENI